MSDPLAYFITIRCYGTWLHGDDQGSVERRRNNIYDEDRLIPSHTLVEFEKERMKYPDANLFSVQQAIVRSTITSVCEYNNWFLHALNVLVNHVHLVVSASKAPEPMMNSLKSWCTRRLRENGYFIGRPVWSRHGSTRWLFSEYDINGACQYVLDGQHQTAS